MPRESAFGKLNRHFHTHPQGRLHEIAFWTGLAVLMGGFALLGWRQGWISVPIALILAVIAICFVLWSLLPPRKGAAKPPLEPGRKSKRR